MVLATILERYIDQNDLHRLEGEQGLENVNTLCMALGYSGDNFKYGSPLEQFLQDNPGALEVLVAWIGEQPSPEWRESLASDLPELDESEDEDA